MDEKIKKHLLELAEDLTEETVEKVFQFLDFYIKNTPNQYDDMVLPFLPTAKQFILQFVNKIDGEE